MNEWYIGSPAPNHCKEANHGRNHHLSITDTAPALGVSAAITDAGRVADPRRIADPESINPQRLKTSGDREMMISSVGRDRVSGTAAAVRLHRTRGAMQPASNLRALGSVTGR